MNGRGKMRIRTVLLLSGLAAAVFMSGCGMNKTSQAEKNEGKNISGEHEPLTIVDAGQDYTELMKLVHEKYPEIQLNVEGYIGQNQSRYFYKQLETDNIPDIYATTYDWDGELQKKYLIDLSGEEFSGSYNEVNLDACSVDGKNYFLPGDYSIQGITYNRTLFQKNGWQVPTNFEELKELIGKLPDAGVQPSVTMLALPGFGFQYFCNVSDTMFLTTKAGLQWEKDFLNGEATAQEGLAESAEYFQEWLDCGMINGDSGNLGINECREKFYEGNTAFMLGTTERWTQNADGSGDQYGLMPYLSRDGSENMYIISVRRYYGLNKHLEDSGNEQKLEDALHFLEVVSTPEGQKALQGNRASTISSLKDSALADDSIYKEATEEIQMGHGAPLIYAGWEAVIADGGEAAADWICGQKTGQEVLETFDRLETDYQKDGEKSFGTAEDTLDLEQCARLTGIMFGEACNADVALVSMNQWFEGVDASEENIYGVNGRLFAGNIAEEDLVVFLPTGWYDTIHTAQLTGREIKEFSEKGFQLYYEGYTQQPEKDITYPYELIVKGGKALEDDRIYTTVLCGDPEVLYNADRITDTGISGLEAARAYIEEKRTISADTLEWK